MSDHLPPTVLVLSDELAPLRSALMGFGTDLATRGVPLGAVRALRIRTAEPARHAPQLRAVDLALRDLFGGFVPAVDVVADRTLGSQVLVEAELATATPPASGAVASIPVAPAAPVYHGYTLAELARQYGPRAMVPDHMAIFERWKQTGRAFAASHPAYHDVAYGPTPGQTFDLYVPAGASAAPLALFIHGGYWQAMDKAEHAQCAAPFLAAGVALAVLNYDLAPQASLATIVAQLERATAFLGRNAARFGCADRRMTVVGHSAGGHLAAWLASVEWPNLDPLLPADLIAAAIPISGLFDLEPVALLPMGRILGLDPSSTRALSPLHRRPQAHVRHLVVVGRLESEEFHWQSETLVAVWRRHGADLRYLDVPGTHHFSVVETIASEPFGSALAACIAPGTEKWAAL
jgi:arylformamidase